MARNENENISGLTVPDTDQLSIQYIDKTGQVHTELIEIKPASQTILERVGKNKYNQAQYVKNQAKWAAATNYCKDRGWEFKILTEKELGL